MSKGNEASYLRQFLASLIFIALGGSGFCLATQTKTETSPEESPVATIRNGDMEAAGDDELPADWVLTPATGAKYVLDSENPFQGEHCLLIDSTGIELDEVSMLSVGLQRIDATAWQGKRIRVTAAVRTSDLLGAGRLQMTAEVTRTGDDLMSVFSPVVCAEDDMNDRPIKNEEWERHSIVLEVDPQAAAINVGWKMIGIGRAWIDDISLEEVDASVPLTVPASEEEETSDSEDSPERSAIIKAYNEVEAAPQQPFFTPWMWCAAVALILFAVGSLPAGETRMVSASPLEYPTEQRVNLGFFHKFAFRFVVIYWVLFFIKIPFLSYLGEFLQEVSSGYQDAIGGLLTWQATSFFGIEGPLVRPNGSGDTTFNYLELLSRFLISLALALVWSLVDWRKTDYRIMRDLLQSYLRYCLASAMLVYGLAKLAWEHSNQFPSLVHYNMDGSWGDSSPMGVVWKFMGASRPYTWFAGFGEFLGASLLVFRRTSLVGAMVAIGVMTNVVMLNYCYDIPVKIFSSHLLVMAFCVLLGFYGTLKSLLFLGGKEPASLMPPYVGPRSKWLYFPIKFVLLLFVFLIPCWNHFSDQIRFYSLANLGGDYAVEAFRVDDETMDPDTFKTAWKEATTHIYWGPVEDSDLAYNIVVKVAADVMAPAIYSCLSGENVVFTPNEFPTIPQGETQISVLDDETIQIRGVALVGEVEIVLKKIKNESVLLRNRGFRWINEVPFNR